MRLVLLMLCALAQAVANTEPPLTNETVAKMAGAGVPEATIIKTIEASNAVSFQFQPAQMDWLMKQGVSEATIKAMAARSSRSAAVQAPALAASPQLSPEPRQRMEPLPEPAPRRVVPPSSVQPRSFSDIQWLSPDGKKNGTLALSGESITFGAHVIPSETVSRIDYERAAKPRYTVGMLVAWPLLFTKSKQHFLTIQHGGTASIFRLDKGNYREVLASMEAATGIRVDRHEER